MLLQLPAGLIDMGEALAIAGLVAGVAGTAVNAYGAYRGGQAQATNNYYQAQVVANNAIIARRNASLTRQAGDIAAGNQFLKTRAEVGKMLAAEGASGVEVNKGSFVGAP